MKLAYGKLYLVVAIIAFTTVATTNFGEQGALVFTSGIICGGLAVLLIGEDKS